MFKGTLEVGKEYELNNGEVHQCGCGFFADHKIGGALYTPDGQYCAATADHPRSVRGPAVGTLAELDVKPGDVVDWIFTNHPAETYTVISAEKITYGAYEDQVEAKLSGLRAGIFGDEQFRIISRAEHTAKPDTPTLFGNMTDAEKGVLLLANHGGQGVQAHINGQLLDVDMYSMLADDVAYRVKPKPVVKTVVLSGNYEVGFTDAIRLKHTHKLKFDMIHGEPTNPRFERW